MNSKYTKGYFILMLIFCGVCFSCHSPRGDKQGDTEKAVKRMTNEQLREKLALALDDMKAKALGGVIPGLVLAWVGFKAGEAVQPPMAEQGILWLVTIIPAVLFVLAIYVIGKYELTDEKMDEINEALSNKSL